MLAICPTKLILLHLTLLTASVIGCAMAQAVSRRPLPRRPGFDPKSVHVGFVVDKVALRQVFPRVRRFSHVNIIPPLLHYMEKLKKKLIIFLFIVVIGCVRSICCGALVQSRLLNESFCEPKFSSSLISHCSGIQWSKHFKM
jgi:hypothetical protein